MNRVNAWLLGASLLTTASLALPQTGAAAGPMQMQGDMAGMKMMPQTAEQHSAMAESYKKKAAGYREDAETHRLMLADYKKGAAPGSKGGGENPWVTKMRVHCEKYIEDAKQMATDADQFAQFHAMRAKEMQGQ